MTSVSLPLLAFLGVLSVQQTPPTPPPPPLDQLGDVEVTARANRDMAREFVRRAAAPARGRGLGRWKEVCPAVVNLEPTAAQDIANRIAGVAHELGVEVQAPGCTANIVVVFTNDASSIATALVEANPRVYHVGVGSLNRGAAALRDWQTTDRPVRWWHMSVPINSDTGERAVRIPGDRTGVAVDSATAAALGCDFADDCAIGAAPVIVSTSASRLHSQVVDQIYKAIIIVDIDEAAGLTTAQLGDYLTMVSLAQIDPEADTAAFDTVLNLFADRTGVAGLTGWDEAYLRALYESPSGRRSASAQASAVAAIMNRALDDDTRRR